MDKADFGQNRLFCRNIEEWHVNECNANATINRKCVRKTNANATQIFTLHLRMLSDRIVCRGVFKYERK